MSPLPTARGALKRLNARPSDALDLVVRTSYAALVAALHLTAGFLLLSALLWSPEGPWDHTTAQDVKALCVGVIVLELLAGALTFAAVMSRRLRTWWYWLPPALLLATAVRAFFPPAG